MNQDGIRHTRVRIAPTRIPAAERPGLARLARRCNEVCTQHGAPLQAHVGLALEVALLDIASAELRAENAEQRARRAERDLAAAQRKVLDLERTLADRARDEFEEPTRTCTNPHLVQQCRP